MAAEQVQESLSDYIRTENAKEREAAGLDGPAPPLPEAEPMTAAETGEAEAVTADIPAPAAEPVVEAASERNTDGTFRPKADSVQKRIDKAVKAQRDAERRAEAAEARAREIEAARVAKPAEAEPAKEAKPAKPVADGRPTIDQWVKDHPDDPDPLSSFAIAAAEWVAAKRDEKVKAEADQVRFNDRRAEIEAAGREQFPDWQEVISSEFGRTFTFPPPLFNAIFESEHSPALIHYLGTHPDDARALAAQPTHTALVSLGTLTARLTPASNGSGARPMVHSKAKPLTKPLRGSTPSAPSSATLDPETTSLKDWIRLNNAADRRRAMESRGA
jgi:hypothetical protein